MKWNPNTTDKGSVELARPIVEQFSCAVEIEADIEKLLPLIGSVYYYLCYDEKIPTAKQTVVEAIRAAYNIGREQGNQDVFKLKGQSKGGHGVN